MDPTAMVGLDRGHSAECHAGFRLSPEGLVHSIGRLDIEVTMNASLLGPSEIPFSPAVAGQLRFMSARFSWPRHFLKSDTHAVRSAFRSPDSWSYPSRRPSG